MRLPLVLAVAVVLAIATGSVLGGIVGALLAVPTTAFLNNALQVLLARDPEAEAEEQVEEADSTSVMAAEPDRPE